MGKFLFYFLTEKEKNLTFLFIRTIFIFRFGNIFESFLEVKFVIFSLAVLLKNIILNSGNFDGAITLFQCHNSSNVILHYFLRLLVVFGCPLKVS